MDPELESACASIVAHLGAIKIQEVFAALYGQRWREVPIPQPHQVTYTQWLFQQFDGNTITESPAFSCLDGYPPDWVEIPVPPEVYDQALQLERQSLVVRPCSPGGTVSESDTDVLIHAIAQTLQDSPGLQDFGPAQSVSAPPPAAAAATPTVSDSSPRPTLPDIVAPDGTPLFPELAAAAFQERSPSPMETETITLDDPDEAMFDSDATTSSGPATSSAEESQPQPDVLPVPDAAAAEPVPPTRRSTRETRRREVYSPPPSRRVVLPPPARSSSRSRAREHASTARRSRSPLRIATARPLSRFHRQLSPDVPPRSRSRSRARRDSLRRVPADFRLQYPEYHRLGIILPHRATGYRPYPAGYQAAAIDTRDSRRYRVYLLPPVYADNLKRRKTVKKKQTGQATRHQSAPRSGGDNGLLTPVLVDPRLALGLYESVTAALQHADPRALRGWARLTTRAAREVVRLMIVRPEAPLTYPAINHNTESAQHQCFLPASCVILPNPILDLVSQFGSRYRMPDHLPRVCPYRHLGCPWEAMATNRFIEHFNLTHVRYPILFLCPCAAHGCFFLGSTTEDVDQHIKARATRDRHHNRLFQDAQRNPVRARSAYVLVRVLNPQAILVHSWPRILDWTPTSLSDPTHPDYRRAQAAWNNAIRRLLTVPGCNNTAQARAHVPPDAPAVEQQIARVFRRQTNASLRFDMEDARRNLSTWTDAERNIYPVPDQPIDDPTLNTSVEAVTTSDTPELTSDSDSPGQPEQEAPDAQRQLLPLEPDFNIVPDPDPTVCIVQSQVMEQAPASAPHSTPATASATDPFQCATSRHIASMMPAPSAPAASASASASGDATRPASCPTAQARLANTRPVLAAARD